MSRQSTTVLFQGDSITDCDRDRSVASGITSAALGSGYPLVVANELSQAHPDRAFVFVNRGISGNRVPNLAARWDADALDLEPDVLSVLIGVNDFWHRRAGKPLTSAAEYERDYQALLDRTRVRLPRVHLVVIEPFVLRTGEVDSSWFPGFDERREVAARVAARVDATFVTLQATFDALSQRFPPESWADDGVHPTKAGHDVIARRWLSHVQV